MNSSTKARSLDGFPRVRKRNSISNKANSSASQNVIRRCTSLLRNNKSLAETLQETRCELSTYKNFFEDSLECMSKVKLARSNMMQLSTSLKNFIKAFDESLLLMDFDDSKWPNIKTSKFNKSIPKGMNTLFEATDEVEEAVSVEQRMYCHESNNFEASGQTCESTSSPSRALQNSANDEGIPEVLQSESPQKKTEDAKGNDGTRTEIHNCPDSISFQTSTEAFKKTKIPRRGHLTGNLKRQNLFKKAEPQNSKSCKRRSPGKMCKKSDFDFSKRKTFVIKSNNILTNSESATKQTDVEETSSAPEDVLISIKDKRKTYVKKIPDISNESEGTKSTPEDLFVSEKDKRKTYLKKNPDISNESEETKSTPEDLFVSEKDKRKTYIKKNTDISNESGESTSNLFVFGKDKRKTCVIKNSNILKETEAFACLNREVVLENRVIFSESSDTDNVFFSETNRKTFVEKSSDKMVLPQNNISKYQHSSPLKACTNAESELSLITNKQDENSGAQNVEASSEFQCCMDGLQTDLVAFKTESITDEVFEPTVRVTVKLNDYKEMLSNAEDKMLTAIDSNIDDKMEETSENLNSKTDSAIPNDNPMHSIDELNREVILGDVSPKDEVCKHDPIGTRRSFFESSEFVCEVLFVEEIDFCEKRPAFQTTPIRRQVSKNKKKKFNFDVKDKKKSILKKNSSCESNANVVTINKNDVKAVKDKSVHFASDELVNKDNITNLQSDLCGTKRKKITKASNKKMKENQETSIKNNAKKAANKLHKIKDIKGSGSKEVEVDDLIPKPKKPKKKNVKKKKNEGAYFDDDVISKYREGSKVISQIDDEIDGTEKDLETDFPCKKTGKNTFLVHAEIHAPPPFTNVPEIEKLDEEIAKLKLKNMEVAVVLDDVLKSKDIKLLNVYDRDLLCGKPVSMSFSESASNMCMDPEESIEKLRCDPVPDTEHMCLHSDALLNTSNFDLQSDPGTDSETTRTRRRKVVNYKEPLLNRKMRRC